MILPLESTVTVGTVYASPKVPADAPVRFVRLAPLIAGKAPVRFDAARDPSKDPAVIIPLVFTLEFDSKVSEKSDLVALGATTC